MRLSRSVSRRTAFRTALVTTVVVGSAGAAFADPTESELGQILVDISQSANTSVLGVVNRPESPFVVSLSGDSEGDSCGVGGWARGSAGHAETSGNVYNVNVDVAGAQFGIDMSCVDVNDAGLDVTFGVMGGSNTGTGTIDGGFGEVNFDSFYAGIYGAFSVNGLVGDLSVRGDKTDYSTLGVLGVDDGVAVTADRLGVSGSLRYAFNISEGLQLIPVVGFDVSRTSTSRLEFQDTTSVGLDDLYSDIVYVGGQVSKTFLLEDGSSAIIPSVSAAYYADLSPSTDGDYDGTPFTVPPGDDIAEVGAGLAYTKIMDGSSSGIQQVTASVRTTHKWNDGYSSAYVSGQVRLQF